MKKKRKEMLRRLAEITEVAFQAAQVELRRKTEAENRFQRELSQIDNDRMLVIEALQLSERTSPAQIVSQSRWLIWAERQRAMKTMELARARAASLTYKDAAKRCLGRNEVAKKLSKD